MKDNVNPSKFVCCISSMCCRQKWWPI